MKNSRNQTYLLPSLLACLLAAAGLPALAQSNSGADNGKPFQDVHQAITADEAEIIAAIEAEAAVREAADQELQDQIDAIVATLDELASLSMTLEEVQADVASLQTTIDIMNDQLDSLLGDTTANTEDIASLQESIWQLEDEMLSKQDILDGTCDEGSTLQAIFPDGSFLCEISGGGGASGSLSTVIGESSWMSIFPHGTAREKELSCPAGYTLLSGGYRSYTYNKDTRFQVIDNMPVDATTWRLSGVNSGTQMERLKLRLVCAH